jgi:toxin ParE1/3/4
MGVQNFRWEVLISRCRVFYSVEGDEVFLMYVMRAERLLRLFLLEERNRTK